MTTGLVHDGEPLSISGRPLGEGPAVVIMIHGRNAGPTNILELAPLLRHPEFTYLAPSAAGRTWYPHSFLAPIQENEPGISSGIAVVHRLIDQAEAHGLTSDRIVLLGFSQGGCLAATAAHRRPTRYGGVVIYSGGLIGPPGTTWETAGSFEGTPVFLGCGDPDAHVPAERVHESAAVFAQMEAQVTARIYPDMGHTVSEDELAFTRQLLREVARGT